MKPGAETVKLSVIRGRIGTMSSYRTEHQVIPEVQAVIDAWLVQGPIPLYHEAKKDQLRHEWPTLANALDALAEPPR